MKTVFSAANIVLNKLGLSVSRVRKKTARDIEREEFLKNSKYIVESHDSQTLENVKYLREKYKKPVFGDMYVWDLMKDLSRCIDPTDPALYCVSQLVHTLQVVEAMEEDGVTDEDMIISALIHDLGKLLLLTDEKPENIVCMNTVITSHEKGVGLDNCVFQWNHDEFVYDRFRDHVPDNIAWIIRYHSIMINSCAEFMDERDRSYTDKYLKSFRKYDMGSKSIYNLPDRKLEDYKQLIEKHFPEPIMF